MQFLLVAVNAKYIHSNLAVYSLSAYAKAKGLDTEIAEYTINHQMESVLRDIYRKRPRAIGFSCYIWNMDFIKELAEELHKLLPQVPIWLGGPEVSWNPEERLLEMPFVTGIMLGEGEETFVQLAAGYASRSCEAGNCASGSCEAWEAEISGLCIRDRLGNPVRTAKRELLSMDSLIFPYQHMSDYENRIIYYETSRGCPFSCSYCLSSVEKKLRFRSLSLVFEELDFFLREKTAQVKFVDRTFNCRHEHAYAIWKYILEHDNGITNFHFEISADLLREEDFALFAGMRQGLIQLETGVQTTNPETIRAIGRTMNLEKVAQNTERVRRGHNIHQHLDLIAGLPKEDLNSFKKSFNDVYAMKPDQLQLGFLKVLHGTRMEREKKEHGLVYRTHPAYEILYTRWLSYDDILQLKNVEETLEEYYNSGQFTVTLSYIMPFFETPFDFYVRFGDFLRAEGYRDVNQNRVGRYRALRHFLKETLREKEGFFEELLDELLTFDYCLREKLNRVPEFVPDQEKWKKLTADFFAKEIKEGRWFGEEALDLSYRQLRGRCQPLVFRWNVMAYAGKFPEMKPFCNSSDTKATHLYDKMPSSGWLAVFDYENRSALDHNANVIWIPLAEFI
ncbi:MAG: DUF4080 domain-containing protein [Lachnospiraceae bacterium]|nr:DUF4080 domain-containing protein [Lachnospiraceae bacterium]